MSELTCKNPSVNGKYEAARNDFFEEEGARLAWLLECRRILIRRLRRAPEGMLQVKKTPSGIYYAKLQEAADKASSKKESRHRTSIYLSKTSGDEIARLAQKSYDAKALRVVEREIKFLQTHAIPYTGKRLEEVYAELQPAVQEYVTPVNTHAEERFRMFEKMGKGRRNTYPFSESEFFSSNGIQVRSKSELMGANMLESEDIPYYYELELYLSGYGFVYPDFTVLNKRTGDIFYWEHFGRMGDENYYLDNIKKIRAYERNGYFLGDSLLATFESSDQPLTTRELRSLIDRHFK